MRAWVFTAEAPTAQRGILLEGEERRKGGEREEGKA